MEPIKLFGKIYQHVQSDSFLTKSSNVHEWGNDVSTVLVVY